MRQARFVTAGAAALLLAGAAPGAAEDAPTGEVAVSVIGEGQAEIAARICEELEAAGIGAEPVTAGPAPGDALPAVRELAASEQAAAAILVDLSAGRIDIWIADRVTGKAVNRTAEIRPGRQPLEAVVAVLAVELLRASLLEIGSGSGIEGEVRPAPEIVAFARSPARQVPRPAEEPAGQEGAGEPAGEEGRLSLAVGYGITAAASEMRPASGFAAAVQLRIAGPLHAAVAAALPVAPSTAERDEGEIDLRPWLVTGGLRIVFRGRAQSVRPYLGLCGGAAFLDVRGRAAEGYVLNDTTTPLGVVGGELGLAVGVARSVALRIDVLLAGVPGRHELRVAGEKISVVGRPWFGASFGIDITLW